MDVVSQVCLPQCFPPTAVEALAECTAPLHCPYKADLSLKAAPASSPILFMTSSHMSSGWNWQGAGQVRAAAPFLLLRRRQAMQQARNMLTIWCSSPSKKGGHPEAQPVPEARVVPRGCLAPGSSHLAGKSFSWLALALALAGTHPMAGA